MKKELIDRINFLAHKSKTEAGLTKEERAEQQRLRAQYIEEFRRDTLDALRHIDIQNPDGSIEPLIKPDSKH